MKKILMNILAAAVFAVIVGVGILALARVMPKGRDLLPGTEVLLRGSDFRN